MIRGACMLFEGTCSQDQFSHLFDLSCWTCGMHAIVDAQDVEPYDRARARPAAGVTSWVPALLDLHAALLSSSWTSSGLLLYASGMPTESTGLASEKRHEWQ